MRPDSAPVMVCAYCHVEVLEGENLSNSGDGVHVHFNKYTDCTEQFAAKTYAEKILDGKLDLEQLRLECNQRLKELPLDLAQGLSFDDGSWIGWEAFKRDIQKHLAKLIGDNVNLTQADASKIIAFLSASYMAATDGASRAEFKRLADELRRVSGQK